MAGLYLCVMRDRPLSPQGDPIAVAQELLQSHYLT